MKRRRFLRYLSVLGAGVALPAFARSSYDAGWGASATESESSDIHLAELADDFATRIVIVAVGGAAGAILAAQGDLPGRPRTLVINTDVRGLRQVGAEHSMLIRTPSGRKARSPQEACRLARGRRNEIADALADSHLAIVIAGMGGAAGTGIAPVVAEVLHDHHIPTIGIPVLPFSFEGRRRQQIALSGEQALERWVTSSLTIPNDTLFRLAGDNALFSSVTGQAATIFGQFYRALYQAIAVPGLIGVDFEDLCHVLGSGRRGRFACGESLLGLQSAAQSALEQPLLDEASLRQSAGLYVAIEAPPSALKMREVAALMRWIRERVSSEVVMFSANVNAEAAASYRVSMLAVGA